MKTRWLRYPAAGALFLVALGLSVPAHEWGHCWEIWAFDSSATCRVEFWSSTEHQECGYLGGTYGVPDYPGRGLVHLLIMAITKGGALVVGGLAWRWAR